jgi:hypothetical protein
MFNRGTAPLPCNDVVVRIGSQICGLLKLAVVKDVVHYVNLIVSYFLGDSTIANTATMGA